MSPFVISTVTQMTCHCIWHTCRVAQIKIPQEKQLDIFITGKFLNYLFVFLNLRRRYNVENFERSVNILSFPVHVKLSYRIVSYRNCEW